MLPQNLPGGIEESHKKCQTSLSLWPRFEVGTCQLKYRRVTGSAKMVEFYTLNKGQEASRTQKSERM